MARRRKRVIEVSLFPFLSVLVCIIGSLTLLIITIAVGSTMPEGGVPQPVATTQQVAWADVETGNEIAHAQVDANKELLNRLRAELREITSLQRQIQIARPKAEARGKERTSLTEDINDLLAQILAAEKKLTDLKDRFGPPGSRKLILPGQVRDAITGKHRYYPLYIECGKDGARLLPAGEWIATNSIQRSRHVLTSLARVRRAGNWCVFMLIRPDGVKPFDKLFQLVQGSGIPYGLHPVYGSDRLDAGEARKPD